MRNCARPVIHRIQEFRPVLTARGQQRRRCCGQQRRRWRGARESREKVRSQWRASEPRAPAPRPKWFPVLACVHRPSCAASSRWALEAQTSWWGWRQCADCAWLCAMPRYPRSHCPPVQPESRSPNREPAGGSTVAGEYHANSGRLDQVLYAADTTGHIMPSYIPGNSEAQRTMDAGNVPRTWVPDEQGNQDSVAVSKGEWRTMSLAPPASAR
jgi:hypothetical protein